MTEQVQWCWVQKSCFGEEGSLTGPFESRFDAISDARGCFNPESFPVVIVVGQVKNIRPEDYPPRFDTYDLLERMEEAINDNDLAFEDQVFYLKNKHEVVERHLQEALKAFVKEWVLSDGWILDDATKEEVTLHFSDPTRLAPEETDVLLAGGQIHRAIPPEQVAALFEDAKKRGLL
jgi:hypothetical protein